MAWNRAIFISKGVWDDIVSATKDISGINFKDVINPVTLKLDERIPKNDYVVKMLETIDGLIVVKDINDEKAKQSGFELITNTTPVDLVSRSHNELFSERIRAFVKYWGKGNVLISLNDGWNLSVYAEIGRAHV